MRDYCLHRKTDSQIVPTNCKQGRNEVQDLQIAELLTYDNFVLSLCMMCSSNCQY